MDKLSYALGMVIGQNLKSMGVGADTLNTADFATALGAVLSGADTPLSDAEAQQTVAAFLQAREAELRRRPARPASASWPKTPKRKASSPCPAACNIPCFMRATAGSPRPRTA